MKSLLAILFVVVLAAALMGCSCNPCNQCNPCGPCQVAPVYQSPCCPAPGGGIG